MEGKESFSWHADALPFPFLGMRSYPTFKDEVSHSGSSLERTGHLLQAHLQSVLHSSSSEVGPTNPSTSHESAPDPSTNHVAYSLDGGGSTGSTPSPASESKTDMQGSLLPTCRRSKAVPKLDWDGPVKLRTESPVSASSSSCSGRRRSPSVESRSKLTLCRAPDCPTMASFGEEEDRVPLYCCRHKVEGRHVDVKNRRCMHAGCGKVPTYGVSGSRVLLFCVAHKAAEHVDVVHLRCSALEGCTRQGIYAQRGTPRERYCLVHRLKGMATVSTRRCAAAGCGRRPIYGHPLDRRPLFCSPHRLLGGECMEDMVHRRCLHPEGCNKFASFCEPGGPPLFCANHKLPHHCSAKSRACTTDGCNLKPIFGAGSVATHCLLHHLRGQHKVGFICVVPTCSRTPSFGDPAESMMRFCASHRRPTDVDLVNSRCAQVCLSVSLPHAIRSPTVSFPSFSCSDWLSASARAAGPALSEPLILTRADAGIPLTGTQSVLRGTCGLRHSSLAALGSRV